MAHINDKIKGENGEYYINRAKIDLDWEQIKDESDAFVYSVILHEFTHILGFNDVYYNSENKNTHIIDYTTVINTYTDKKINCLYPNDYAVLQALYSNEYKKHDDYSEAIRIVNDKIESYTLSFYQYYSEFLTKNNAATNKMKISDLKENIEWNEYFEDGTYNKISIKFTKDGTCKFVIKNEKEEILEETNAEYLFENGFLFIRNIMINNSKNYNQNYDESLSMKLMLSIYVDENGIYVINDGIRTCCLPDYNISKVVKQH